METKAGIWIDREHAIAVVINSTVHELKSFQAGIPEPFPQTEESRAQHEYTRNDFVAEDKLERKQAARREVMYDAILKYTHDAKELLILGPGEAKKEFQKHIDSKSHDKTKVEVETSDRLTDPQLVAHVLKHFSLPSSPSAPRK